MAKKDETKSKRQIVREQRIKRQRQQRLLTIGIVAAVALVVAFFLIAPSIRNAMTPVGEITRITPEARQNVDGRAIGDVNAPVLVEVWSDFQCPACRSYSESIEPQLLQNYAATDKILKGTLPRNWAYGTRMVNRPFKVYTVQRSMNNVN